MASGIFLQLTQDLDMWLGQSNPTYRTIITLQKLWEDSRVITSHNTYIPFGIDALLRQLQTNSFFKHSLDVQNLDISRFIPPDGFITVVNLFDFLNETAKPSPLVDVVADNLNRWIEQNNSFGFSMGLENLWNTKGIAIPYNPNGIDRLCQVIKDGEFFDHCGKAQNLDRPVFTNGTIKTVGQLHNFLLPCA